MAVPLVPGLAGEGRGGLAGLAGLAASPPGRRRSCNGRYRIRQVHALARRPRIPDPDNDGGFRVTAGQIDPNSPIVTAAAAACRSTLRARGGLTAGQLVQGAAGTLKRK